MRIDVNAPRFSPLQVMLGAVLAAALMVAAIASSTTWTSTPGCTAAQGSSTAHVLKMAKTFVPLPPVADGAAQQWLDAISTRFDELAAQQAAADAKLAETDAKLVDAKAPNLTPSQWLYAILGLGASGGTAYAAARSSASQKVEAQGKTMAVAVGSLLATPSAERTPAIISQTLTNALPGEARVQPHEVAGTAPPEQAPT